MIVPVFHGGRAVIVTALALAAVGFVGLVAGALLAPDRVFFSYLAAWAYVLSIALGALLFLMIGHAMRAGWPTLVRRLTEGAVGTLPLLALLVIPLLFGLRRLYPWLRLESIPDPRERAVVALKLPYLNLGWFLGRTAFFFTLWIAVGHWLRRWSLAQDADAAARVERRLHVLSGALLPPVALAFSFAAFDWLMSLTPAWYSTMYPVYVFAGGFLAALALLTLTTAAADRRGLLPGVRPSHYHALGRLLLAFVIFWAYAAFFQLLIIWIANKPDEVTFYLDRIEGRWRYASAALVLAQFVFPFFALLSYELKRRRGPLAAIAAWLLAAHYLDVHWLVIPAAPSGGAPGILLDLAALACVGGLAVAYGVHRLRGQALYPIHDPALARALTYESR